MMPFLASGSITVHKADGSRVDINSDGTQDDSDESSTATVSHPSASAKRHHDSGDLDGTVVPIVAIVFVFLWLIVKALMAPFTQKAGKRAQMPGPTAVAGGLTDEEQAILERLQRTIGQMERRIESLETILIDQTRTKEKYGTKL